MGSRGGVSSGGENKTMPAPWSLRRRVCLALCLLLLLSGCSPCQGRKLLLAAAGEEEGGKAVMYFEGGLVLRVPPPPSGGGVGEASAAVPAPRGFAATAGRAARLMRSVPSPGVGH